MTDLEINKALALAIGWTEDRLDTEGLLDPDVAIFGGGGQHEVDEVKVWNGEQWRTFDYRDPAVIWPIAERYGCFPSDMVTGNFQKHKKQGYPDKTGWEIFMMDYKRSSLMKAHWVYHRADTAAKCVALAVIGATS